MSGITARLHDMLDLNDVEYEIIHHRTDFRAQRAAADTHTSPEAFAKTVFIEVDGRYAMAVLPAPLSVSEGRLAKSLGAARVRVVSEAETADLCPDSEVGAAPPFGNLYDLPVYVCPDLAQAERITFNAGSHSDAVRIAYEDFERIAKPERVHMSRHEQAS